MDYRLLHMKTVAELRQLAKENQVKIPLGTKKAQMVELILEKQQAMEQAAEKQPAAEPATAAPAAAETAPAAQQPAPKMDAPVQRARRGRPRKVAAVNPEMAAQAESVQAKPDPAKAVVAAKPVADAAPVADQMESAPVKPDAVAPTLEKVEPTVQTETASVQAEPAITSAEKADADKPVAQAAAEKPAAVENPATEANPAAREIRNPAYHRPMSTQQRMGARTYPAMNTARPQQSGRMGQPIRTARMQDGQMMNRPQRNYEPQQRNYEPQQRNYDAPQRNYEPQQRSYEPQQRNYEPQQRSYEPQQRDYEAPQRRSSVNAMNAANADAQPPRRPFYAPDAPKPADEGRPAGEDYRTGNTAIPDLLASGECGDGAGILEIHADGYGFLRVENYLPGNRDVYVSAAQIRRFNLRTGDYVVGKTRSQQASDRSVGLIYINEVNGQTPDMARRRVPFDALVPIYPNERLRMEYGEQKDLSLRLIDLLAPIGKGQRGMIVSPPKAGKTTLLKKIANAITVNNPDVHLIVLLIDERPEEVTDMKRSIQGEVVYSTFDEAPENHTRVSEMVLERAQRLVETGKDVVVLLDSITRLARAYNLVIPPTGRSLSGGLDPGALFRPKRFFGAARNIENGGSLTIIATALVDTGSRMDDIIFEEFKGTGNMELHLDRSLSDRRIFPAIDMFKSGTRREELLLTPAELEGVYQVRRMLSRGNAQEASEQMISLIEKSSSNAEFLQRVKNWSLANKKDGYK